MSRVWDADVDLSPEAAARLIERQFPTLAPVRLEPLGAGWDNAAFLVFPALRSRAEGIGDAFASCNERIVFRFPRRRIAVRFIEAELRVLPLLAPHLPLPIPVPTWVGAPADGYPYPFVGYRYLSGTPACQIAWSDEERARNAATLGRFLAALHRIPVDDATRAWAPREEVGRPISPLRERLRSLAPVLKGIEVEPLADLADRLVAAPAGVEASCWVHGDLYASHLLVDDRRQLCGVIDWGDVHLGNPAIDLMIAFSFLPPAARGVFRAAYGPINAATWDRARCHALHYGVSLVEYATEVGNAGLRTAGEYALRSGSDLRTLRSV